MSLRYSKHFLLLLLFLSVRLMSLGQTITCDNPYPNCFGINGISFSDVNNGWAVGSYGLVAHYDGTDWTLDNGQDKTQNTLRKSFFLDANTGWIVGDNGTILKYKNGVYTLQTSNTSNALYDLHFLDEDHGWAAGANNIILKYASGVWSVDKTTDVTNSLYMIRGIHMINANRGWAVGDGGNMYKYNGTSWKLMSSVTTNALFDVTFADSTLGYAVGEEGVIFKYSLNDHWVQVPGQSGFVYDLYTVQIMSAGNVWASGSYATLINYNGTAWSAGSAQGIWYTGLAMVGARDGWTFGTDGTIYKITNGVVKRFNTIFKNSDGTPSQSDVSYLSDLSLQADGNGWIVSEAGDLFEMRSNVWKKQAVSLSSSNTYYSIAVVNDTLGFVVGENGTIYKYNGISWTKVTTSFQSSISSSTLYKVFILDATHVYIVGTGGVFIRYIADVWEKVTVTGQPSTDFYDVQFVDANTGWISGAGGVLMKYKNGTFAAQSYPNTYGIVKVFFFDETEGWSISASDILHYASNAWTTVPSDQVLVSDFVFTDKNNGLLIGPPYYGGGAGGIVAQYSGGTFTRVPRFDFTQNFASIKMFSATQGVIIGESGLILRIGEKPAVVVTGIEENIFENGVADMTYSLVPNPASQLISIYKAGFPLTGQHVLITSLDGTVMSDQLVENEYINIASLKKGMYFIRLSDLNTVLKFIKE